MNSNEIVYERKMTGSFMKLRCDEVKPLDEKILLKNNIPGFLKMVEILEVDADDLLGKCPKEKEKNKYDTLVRRIQQLKENEQKIVMQTMEVLIDGINKFHK